MSRNQYLDYFHSFFAVYGPFFFGYEKPLANGATITFMNHGKTESYTLKFQKIGTSWGFVTPQVRSLGSGPM